MLAIWGLNHEQARSYGATAEAAKYRHPVIGTTWARPIFDLEDPDDQARLADPAFVLRPLAGLVVLDEIQTRPEESRRWCDGAYS